MATRFCTLREPQTMLHVLLITLYFGNSGWWHKGEGVGCPQSRDQSCDPASEKREGLKGATQRSEGQQKPKEVKF